MLITLGPPLLYRTPLLVQSLDVRVKSKRRRARVTADCSGTFEFRLTYDAYVLATVRTVEDLSHTDKRVEVKQDRQGLEIEK